MEALSSKLLGLGLSLSFFSPPDNAEFMNTARPSDAHLHSTGALVLLFGFNKGGSETRGP